MEFNSIKEFIEMGGHGPYVWASYAISVITVLVSIWWPLRQKKNIEADIRRKYLREQNIKN